MLIGIDMLGVQSPEGGGRVAGRFGVRLVAALLDRDPVNRYLLYTHEGHSAGRLPSSRVASSVALTPVAGPASSRFRPTTQRLLDRNPDGLDWLILLDPFSPDYGRLPPESPLNGLKVASVVHDLAQPLADDRRLAPLRRHDAILAVTGATALDWRRCLGQSADRVVTIGLACDDTLESPPTSEPLTRAAGEELGRMGISGPFLFARHDADTGRPDLLRLLDAFYRLPVEHRRRHQLVIAGAIDDPSGARSFMNDRGCDDALILAGEVADDSLRTLYGRCAAFVAASSGPGTGLALVEAMRCGAPVIATRSAVHTEVIGGSGLLVEPAEMTAGIAGLLSDVDLGRELRRRSLDRSAGFSWGPVVESVVEGLRVAADRGRPGARLRVDRPHAVRPRIAVFADVPRDTPTRSDLALQVPADWLDAYQVDLYLEPGDAALADGLPADLGGFDARQFERNDAILGYQAVAYRVGDARTIPAKLERLRRRPGLVFLTDDAFLDRIHVESGAPSSSGPPGAWATLRELLSTSSLVLVHSPRDFDRIAMALPEYAGQLAQVPPDEPASDCLAARRRKARARLDLPRGSVVVGQFGRPGGSDPGLLSSRAFEAAARAVPGLVLLSFESGRNGPAPDGCPTGSGEESDPIDGLDLAIHPDGPGPVSVLDLLKAGIATIAPGSHLPEDVVRKVGLPARGDELRRAVVELASDEEARATLARSALAYSFGTPDARRASALLRALIERCAAGLSPSPGRRRGPTDGPHGLPSHPHFRRPASSTGEAAHRPR